MSGSFMEDAFAHHVWATLRLVDTCLELSPRQLKTAVPGTYGSILDTLRHFIGSDAWDLFVATGDRASLIDEDDMHLSELRAAMESHGPAWSRLLAQDLDPDAVLDEVDEDDGYERHIAMSIELAQALHHGPTTGVRSAPPSRRSGWNRRASMFWISACRRAGSWRSHPRPDEFEDQAFEPPIRLKGSSLLTRPALGTHTRTKNTPRQPRHPRWLTA